MQINEIFLKSTILNKHISLKVLSENNIRKNISPEEIIFLKGYLDDKTGIYSSKIIDLLELKFYMFFECFSINNNLNTEINSMYLLEIAIYLQMSFKEYLMLCNRYITNKGKFSDRLTELEISFLNDYINLFKNTFPNIFKIYKNNINYTILGINSNLDSCLSNLNKLRKNIKNSAEEIINLEDFSIYYKS